MLALAMTLGVFSAVVILFAQFGWFELGLVENVPEGRSLGNREVQAEATRRTGRTSQTVVTTVEEMD